jgi:hypothetical protein
MEDRTMFGKLLLRFSVLLALAVFLPAAPIGAVSDCLPDLGMDQLRDFSIQKTSDGRRLLRFTAKIVNVGKCAFEVRGQRSSTSTPDMTTVYQRIFNDGGSYRDVLTPATMFYAGDGHTHWHLRNLEDYELDRLDNGVKVGTGAKRGFCFFDTERYQRYTAPGVPSSPVYTGSNSCAAGQPSALTAMEGLSIGWGDVYHASLPDQYINITGLGPGRYRLHATADPSHWFTEANESNNFTWVDIQLTGGGLRILGYGPIA